MDVTVPRIEKASHAATNNRILRLIEPWLTQPLRILDVGCGSGYFLNQLADIYRQRGWSIEDNLLGIDIDLHAFRAQGVPTRRVDVNHALPLTDASCDLVLAIEVFEHTRAPYLLMEELARLLAPGGRLIMSVPNVMHVLSRLSYLATGHYYMYPTPSSKSENAGRLCGHIEPLPLQYWHYGLRTAGFSGISCDTDRMKKSAIIPALLLWPLTALGSTLYARRMRRYDVALAQEIRCVLPQVNSFRTLTARSLIFSAQTPG